VVSSPVLTSIQTNTPLAKMEQSADFQAAVGDLCTNVTESVMKVLNVALKQQGRKLEKDSDKYDELKEQHDKLKQQHDELKQQHDELKKKHDGRGAELYEAHAQRRELEASNTKLHRQIQDAKKRYLELDAEVQERKQAEIKLMDKVRDLNAQRDESSKTISTQAATIANLTKDAERAEDAERKYALLKKSLRELQESPKGKSPAKEDFSVDKDVDMDANRANESIGEVGEKNRSVFEQKLQSATLY
jgi:chromosome segregation ATPase